MYLPISYQGIILGSCLQRLAD